MRPTPAPSAPNPTTVHRSSYGPIECYLAAVGHVLDLFRHGIQPLHLAGARAIERYGQAVRVESQTCGQLFLYRVQLAVDRVPNPIQHAPESPRASSRCLPADPLLRDPHGHTHLLQTPDFHRRRFPAAFSLFDDRSSSRPSRKVSLTSAANPRLLELRNNRAMSKMTLDEAAAKRIDIRTVFTGILLGLLDAPCIRAASSERETVEVVGAILAICSIS